jgi:hypothetical protein
MGMNGCLYYTTATAVICFPEGHVCCDLCPCLETYARKQCRLTGEYLADTRGRGYWCPLHIEKKEENYGHSSADFG